MSIVSYSWDLDNPLDRVFNNLVRDWDGARREVRSGRAWTPAMDVHENEKEYIVKAELPGLTKDQVNVDVRDNTLIISGETKKDERYEQGNTHIQERRYGSFTRSLTIPSNVKPEDITAKFEGGLLDLKLPKSTYTPTGKRIDVQ